MLRGPMPAAALLALLVAAGTGPFRIVAPPLTVTGLEPQRAKVWTDYVAAQLSRWGVNVQTEADFAAVLGAERQKQLLGCADEGCLVELAAALDADGLLTGSVGLAEGTRIVNLRIISTQGTPLATASGSAASEPEVLETLRALADQLVGQLKGKVEAGRIGEQPADLDPGLSRKKAIIPAIATFVLGGVGVAGLLVAKNTERGIRDGTTMFATSADLQSAAYTGRTWEAVGFVALSVAAVAAVAAIVIFLVGE